MKIIWKIKLKICFLAEQRAGQAVGPVRDQPGAGHPGADQQVRRTAQQDQGATTAEEPDGRGNGEGAENGRNSAADSAEKCRNLQRFCEKKNTEMPCRNFEIPQKL